ncbi:MAG TPA: succinyldiaminopimelate transaminase [Acidimicrobiia bacterium]|jgi:succinyldiaminopimelate transaminase|nr:succinyldiaminopimelate transaminase [Acidimicrobiia bacterium]
MAEPGFVPPPYPHDRLRELRVVADAVPGGIVDCSVGTPVDPMPEVARSALADAAAAATGYPAAIGAPAYREAAAAWIGRRFGIGVSPDAILACIGTKELVASLPRLLALRDPGRDTVLYPAVAYPTYEMGARLAGLRAVPVPLDERWHLDLSRINEADAARALVIWVNEPGNPTGASGGPQHLRAVADWAREWGAIAASDECYAEFTYDESGSPAAPATVLSAGHDRVLAVHSLSKRSNMAGLRAGFVAGDAALVSYLGEVRKHAGLMTSAPVQAAATAALADDAHVDEQRARYARRRKQAQEALRDWGLVHDGGPSTFYLWLRATDGGEDGWSITRRLAEQGLLVAPGDLYGPDGSAHVRLSLTQTDARLALAFERLAAKERV